MTASSRRLLTIAAGAAVVLLLAVGALLAGRSGPSPQKASGGDAGASSPASPGESSAAGEGGRGPSAAEERIGLTRRDADDVTALGDVDAPVVLIEYADYRCPFCAVFSRDTMPELVSEYVESGRLRVEWRDLPLFGEESEKAAVAARAAGEQGRFWEYHRAVYEAAPERGHLEVTDEKLTAWAEEVGVPDMERFARDLESPELLEQVRADAEEARSQVGATGTPTFVIDDQRMVGAQSAETFRRVIDQQLAARREG
ncbi:MULTISPECIES: DsbA family protein [Kytococcus]|uniref:Disulfide bond formation protein n=1 Tax=Kytococcus schroeteri TaxID=138300 RepID=A0A2I1PAF8_9MICO|nr:MULTISPECIES: thioredoxin domain-containing protein [Kytococcus]OFS06259.1 hypothetical protein HMPREF3099_11265 [Kytococcus sp. HMSC28H12]PKZ41636.1 disulfide bond formation protein [Kytococcus schroeteri]